MPDRIERAVGLRAESDALDRRGPVTEPIHLLPRQHDANGALQSERAKRCQHYLVLWPQAGAEGAAHIGREHADVIGLLAEHAAQKFVDVLDALRLVIDHEFAVAVPDDRACIELHRIVMLGRNEVVRLVLHGRSCKRSCGVAARLVRLLYLGGLAPLGSEIGRKRLLLVIFDPHQRRGEFGGFPVLRYDQRDRLAVELDAVIIERAEGRALLRRHFVLPGLVLVGERRAVRMREHVKHARHLQRLAGVEAGNAPTWNCGLDDEAMCESVGREFAGIFGGPGNLGPTVDARRWCSDIGVHRFLTRSSCEPEIAVWRLRPASASER